MATNLGKLIAEYRAIDELDRLYEQVQCRNESESIGFEVRIFRRREILRELITWISNAEETLTAPGK
jgi:hypothetical protein